MPNLYVPKPPKATAHEPRPPSARDHFALIQQVRASLNESNEQPPAGVSVEDVTARRKLLECLLKDLEREAHLNNQLRHERVEARKAEAERMEEERVAKLNEDTNYKHATHFITNMLLKKDLSDLRALKSAKHHEKVFGCKLHFANKMCDRIESLEASDEDRRCKIAQREQEQERKIRQQREHLAELSRLAEEKRQQKCDQEEADYEVKRMLADERKAVREQRSSSARSRRLTEIDHLQQKQSERQMNGSGRKTNVFFTGNGRPPVLCTVTRDHAERMHLADLSERKARELYAADKELYDALKAAMKQRADRRTLRAMSNYDRILDQKLQRFAEMKEEERLRERHVIDTKISQHREARKKGLQKSQSIAEHMKGAEAALNSKIEKVSTNNLMRWSERSAAAVSDILTRYENMQSARRLRATHAEDEESPLENDK